MRSGATARPATSGVPGGRCTTCGYLHMNAHAQTRERLGLELGLGLALEAAHLLLVVRLILRRGELRRPPCLVLGSSRNACSCARLRASPKASACGASVRRIFCGGFCCGAGGGRGCCCCCGTNAGAVARSVCEACEGGADADDAPTSSAERFITNQGRCASTRRFASRVALHTRAVGTTWGRKVRTHCGKSK